MTRLEWTKSRDDSTWISDADRRDAERNSCDALRPVRLLVRPSFQALPAFIREFSGHGIGLILMRPLDDGVMLAMQLRERHVGVSGILTAHVCHITPLQKKYWSVGCRLSRGLSDAERIGLLRGFINDNNDWRELDE